MLGKDKDRILVNLTKSKIQEIEEMAAKKGVTRNDIITMAIYSYINKERHLEEIEKEILQRKKGS